MGADYIDYKDQYPSQPVLDFFHAHRVSSSWRCHCRFHLFAIRTSSVQKFASLTREGEFQLNTFTPGFLPCSQSFAYGAMLLPAQSARYPDFVRTEIRSAHNPLSWIIGGSQALHSVTILQSKICTSSACSQGRA